MQCRRSWKCTRRSLACLDRVSPGEMYGQPQYGAPRPSPYGYGAPSPYGAPGMAPPPQPGGGMRPPATFDGWFTMYYNMMQPHEVVEAQGEYLAFATFLWLCCRSSRSRSALSTRLLIGLRVVVDAPASGAPALVCTPFFD